ncbi:MAG: OsmC family protein [Bacteroidetes bacterium]|nr:OsmC family protein [Bacteroidota bacterium]MBS1685775.1 OsmC family protein [Bacteroidota bacterium]
MTAEIIYEGHLRTRCRHIQSGTEILTDAPTDNHGKGEAFSPTDLTATSLAACIITTMGIKAAQMPLDIDGVRAEATKVMAADPRRIAEIQVSIYMPAKNYTDKDKQIMERIAHTCPVALSLHPDLRQVVTFHW